MTVINFDWDEVEDNIVAELDDDGNAIATYTTEPTLYGNVISQHRDGQTSYFHHDGIGNTTEITNDNGDVTDTRAYNAFGEITESTGTTEFPFQFVGQKGYYRDKEMGEYSVRARPYEPVIARWTSVDPLGIRGREGLYLYVKNLPVTAFDPSGTYSLNSAIDVECGGLCGPNQFVYQTPFGMVGGAGDFRRCFDDCVSKIMDKMDTKAGKQEAFDIWYKWEKAVLATWYNIDSPTWPACPCQLKFGCGGRGGGRYYLDGDDAKSWTHPDRLWDPDYHPGAEYEIRSPGPLNDSGAGDQCTYDKKGKLITEPLGAGSADRRGAKAEGIFWSSAHVAEDVRTWNLAQELDGFTFGANKEGPNLTKYREVRPTNNKNKCKKNPL